MIIFTTFTSTGYETARDRILREVVSCDRFDVSYTYNEKELTPELLSSPTFKVKKGLGHYSWKPDIIWQTMNKAKDGDIIVYLDAGSSLYDSKEWEKFFHELRVNDILAFRLHQRNYRWTRKSVFQHFSEQIQNNWKDCFQFGANALMLKKTEASMSFISEWRDYMIHRLDLCGDVPNDEIESEDPRLIENRYDQTILTALLYKYMQLGAVKAVWEHFEGYDPFRKQAFIASRIRNNSSIDDSRRPKIMLHGLVKQYLYYPIVGNCIWRRFLKGTL